MLQHGKQGETRAQVFIDHIGAINFVWTAFAQHQQAGCMIYLAIQIDNGLNRRVSERACGLQNWKGGELCEKVWRSVK